MVPFGTSRDVLYFVHYHLRTVRFQERVRRGAKPVYVPLQRTKIIYTYAVLLYCTGERRTNLGDRVMNIESLHTVLERGQHGFFNVQRPHRFVFLGTNGAYMTIVKRKPSVRNKKIFEKNNFPVSTYDVFLRTSRPPCTRRYIYIYIIFRTNDRLLK